MTPPLAAILRAAAWLFGDDTSARVFAPFVADWDHEQRHAATSWRRGLIAARWTLALVTTAACMSWRHAAPGWRAARALAGFSIVGTVILIAPFFRHLASGRDHVLQLTGFLTPQAVALALPFALLPAAILLGAAATPEAAGRLRRRLCAVVAGIVLVTTINLAWVVPEANQAFRETSRAAIGVTAGSLPRGVRELRIADLWHARGVERTAARRELQAKAAIALTWPIGLAVLGWRIGRRRLGNSLWSMAAWWIFAAALIAVVDGWRHVAREFPMALAPVLWLATSALLRPRDRNVTRTSETR